MSAGEVFGPVDPAAGEAPPFAVTGPPQLRLPASRKGSGSFTVTNVTGRPVRARVFVLPGQGADPSWFQVTGTAERSLPVAGTETVDVAVAVPAEAPPGSSSFRLGAALEEAPDRVVPGPSVSLDVPAAPKRRFPWWIVVVAAVAVLVLVGGGILVWQLTRPDPAPTPTPTPTPTGPDPYLRGDVTVGAGTYLDLDAGSVSTSADVGMDVLFFPGAGSGELGVVGQGPPRLAVVAEASHDACASADGYDDLDAQNVLLLPQNMTYVCVRFTDQRRLAVMSIGPATSAGYGVSFVTWERG